MKKALIPLLFGGRGFPGWDVDIDLMADTLDPRVVFSRASTATYINSAGALQAAAVGVPRIDYDPVTLQRRGLLLEESRTNLVRNSQMTGGSAGVWPTNWGATVQAGVTATPGAPTADPITGYTYVDVVFSGSATSTGDLRVNFETSTGVTGTVGQTRTWSAATAVVAGALPAGRQLVHSVVERDSGQVALVVVDLGPANASSTLGRTASNTRTLASAAVAFANGFIKIGINSGDACNFTLRVAAPQCEAGIGASSYIPTTGVAVARSLDLAHVVHSGATPGTLLAEALGRATSVDSYPPLATAAAGGDGNHRAQIFLVAGPTLVSGGFRVDTGGVIQVNSAVPSTRLIANPVRVAVSLQVDNFQCVQTGGFTFSDSNGAVPSTTVIALGGGFQGNQSGMKWLRRVAWRRAPMSVQQLERVVAL